MSTIVDVDLLGDMKKFGAVDVSACFSCGNCTAICPLADNDATFPRRIIRYAQVGMKDELLSSKELWTCYHCGLCSDSCPTEADPGEFMATARRYAIASYDRTGLARILYTQARRRDRDRGRRRRLLRGVHVLARTARRTARRSRCSSSSPTTSSTGPASP